MALKGRDIIVYLAVKYNGDWNAIYQAIKNKEMVDEPTVVLTIAKAVEKYKVLTIIDSDYPDSMKQIYKPPFVLFMDKEPRNTLIRKSNMLGIMNGGKDLNHEEIGSTSTMFNEVLDHNNTTFVGLQNDMLADLAFKIHASKSNTPRSIRVHTSGLEFAQPSDNMLNVSEYYEGPSDLKRIGWATRLVVGTSEALYTPNVLAKSDNQIGIGYAMYMGKFVLMNRSTSKKAMDLFKDGAIMVDTAVDIIDAMYKHSAPTSDATKLEGSPIA
jgi:DNA processing protein